jgi:hypothetical protein
MVCSLRLRFKPTEKFIFTLTFTLIIRFFMQQGQLFGGKPLFERGWGKPLFIQQSQLFGGKPLFERGWGKPLFIQQSQLFGGKPLFERGWGKPLFERGWVRPFQKRLLRYNFKITNKMGIQ